MEGQISLEILSLEGERIAYHKGKRPRHINGEYKTNEYMVDGILRTYPDRERILKGINIIIRDLEGNVLHEYKGKTN